MKNPNPAAETLGREGATREDWEGFEGWSLVVARHPARFIFPAAPAAGLPWIWKPEFFGIFPEVEIALLQRGWGLAFLDLPDQYGSPAAIAAFAALHDFAVEKPGWAPRAAIVALSRAGLSAYHFAAAHPEKVLAIYADNPVCDFRSWPGGFGAGPGSPDDWEKLQDAYHLHPEEARAYKHQPLTVLEPLVEVGIPVLHVCGDRDTVVPMVENSALMKKRFRELGGDYREIIRENCGHHPHGLSDPAAIVAFLEECRLSHP